MCMDCKSDSSLEQYSDHHQIIRSSAPCQNCGDLEGLLSGTWGLLGCCAIYMIQVPSSDLWRLFGALHKYIIQCFITDSWWLKVTVDCTLRYKAPRSDFWSDRHLWKCLLLNDHLLISSRRFQNMKNWELYHEILNSQVSKQNMDSLRIKLLQHCAHVARRIVNWLLAK